MNARSPTDAAREDLLRRLAERERQYDMQPHRVSLYTNLKADHPANDLTGEPCDCEVGGTVWERNGVAMSVLWPPQMQPEYEAGA